MRHNDPAPTALRAFFDVHGAEGKNKQWMADALELSRSAVHYWAEGVNRPETDEVREMVELLTDGAVKAEDWLTDEEREKRDQRRARLAELRSTDKTGTDGS